MNIIKHVYEDVNAGLIDSAFIYREELNVQIRNLLEYDNDTEWLTNGSLMEDLRKAIIIGNAVYNNSDSELLPIEDGVWDAMVEKYRRYTPDDSYPVGFKPIKDIKHTLKKPEPVDKKELFTVISDEEYDKINKMMYKEEILGPNKYIGQPRRNLFTVLDGYIPKRLTDTAHSHPDLVGTFDKCKFVLNAQAREKGVENDPSVRIMERDFFKPLLDAGVIDYSTEFTMIATLKYDGISVEADVTDRVVSARTRGDAVNGIATDITPILEDYRFPSWQPGQQPAQPIGMKFEAIINNFNLYKLAEMKGNKYANCRTAMTGIVGSSDGYKYRDLITLVPISTDYKDENGEPLDRLVEIEFLNRYYAGDQLLRYTVMTGNYTSMLFQIKKYVEEAEFARSYIPFMYDGVVFEFYDKDIRRILGRDSAMDRYKCAIKFNPLTKQTIFRGYEFTIGQDGTITPMIMYDPVEFFGTIHPNSSGHSYKNFKELDLHYDDIINVTYRNDVITYVTKPDNAHNRENANELTKIDFPEVCPCCGTKIEISESGKSARCPNWSCPERNIQRLTATLAKLGVVNFSEETVRTLYYEENYYELADYLNASVENFECLGENNSVELKRQLDAIKFNPMPDYKWLGALGFSNIGEKTWQLICREVKWYLLMSDLDMGRIEEIEDFPSIKGIGPATWQTILNEFNYFCDDTLAMEHCNVVCTYGKSAGKQIRFTGCRDAELEAKMQLQGYDCDGKAGVTKSTSVLLVPYDGYNQGNKVKKAMQYGIPMVALLDFVANPNQYL